MRLEPEDVFKMLQHWVLNITSGTERDNVQLNQQVTTLHTAMVQYMVNVLILLSPDYSSDPSDTTHTAFGEDDFASPVSVQNVHEQALDLSNKLKSFSTYIMRCCQEMVENIPQSEDDGYELRQLQTIKGSCDEWIETCQLLLSKVSDNKAPSETSQHPHTSKNKDVSLMFSRKEISKKVPENTDNERLTEEEPLQGATHTVTPEGRTPAKEPSLQNGVTSENDVVKIIGYDGNIHKKSLREDEIPVAHESALQACRPSTPRSMQAFQSLTSLEQLEKRLLHAEMRSQEAEERSENLDEQLKAALQRIQELEIKFQEDEKIEEIPAGKEVLNEQTQPPASPKKRPKSSKVKQHK